MDRGLVLITNAQKGDKQSEEILLKENMPLVGMCVKKFYWANAEYDDLMQLGSIGLTKAIRRFDTNYGTSFSTYAVPLIMGEIRRFLRDDGVIKVSRTYKEIKNKAFAAQERLSNTLGREANIAEIAKEIDTPLDTLILAMEACAPCDSLERTIGEDGDMTLADVICADFKFGDCIEKIALKTAIDTLGARDRKIIILRYFMGKTQAEVSKLVGISQVQVSRIEKKLITSLRKLMD